jgi:hypothetical protein
MAGLTALLCGPLIILPPRSARAVDCAALNLPNPIYGDGGSAAKPYIGKLATLLANLPQPITVFYKAAGGCAAIYGILKPTNLSGSISYWDKDGKEQKCDLPAVGGPLQDWGNMVNSHKLCPDAPAVLPTDIGDIEGPVTAVNIFTGKTSPEDSISSEAGYFAFGFGNNSQAAPWTDETAIFRRNQNSAVGLYVGLSIGVPPNRQKGVLLSQNEETVNRVATAAKPSAALGYASSDFADLNRDKVKTLAFQYKGQLCGYLPDSSSTSFDKRNVRDGHYWLWGAQHFYGKIDPTTKKLTSPGVATLVGLVTGEVAAPAGVSIAKFAIDTGNVPRCAMTVWRDGDLGEFYSYAPPEPCGCFFEKSVPGGSTTCKVCADDTACASTPGSKCRFGYCEAY